MHGPPLFEATAFFYALFGVSDFTARLYTALVGVAAVLTPWLRKWLGKHGALFASLMILISPSITYYSRYTRHDLPVLLASLLLIWTILKYLDGGSRRWLVWMGVFSPLIRLQGKRLYLHRDFPCNDGGFVPLAGPAFELGAARLLPLIVGWSCWRCWPGSLPRGAAETGDG